METLIQADIFFFITSITVIIIGLFVAAGLFYTVRILRDVKHISSKVREEGDKIVDDVDELREDFKKEGTRLTGVLSVFAKLLARKAKKFKKKK